MQSTNQFEKYETNKQTTNKTTSDRMPAQVLHRSARQAQWYTTEQVKHRSARRALLLGEKALPKEVKAVHVVKIFANMERVIAAKRANIRSMEMLELKSFHCLLELFCFLNTMHSVLVV